MTLDLKGIYIEMPLTVQSYNFPFTFFNINNYFKYTCLFFEIFFNLNAAAMCLFSHVQHSGWTCN